MDGETDGFVTIAIAVSRVEAVVLASMLRGYGIVVHVSGDAHASIEVNSLALGGHHLLVPISDYDIASDILRELPVEQETSPVLAVRKAVLRVVAFWVGIHFPWIVLGAWFGAFPVWAAAIFTFDVAIIPVNPQGRADFYLADSRLS